MESALNSMPHQQYIIAPPPPRNGRQMQINLSGRQI
jgi:hypothetical protein